MCYVTLEWPLSSHINVIMMKVSRTESLKQEKVKRSLSLRAVRHTPSFKDKYKLPTSLPPAEIEGVLERKQDLQNGGKRATIRSWKTMYTVMCGQLLCFFKDNAGTLLSTACFFFRIS